MYWDLVTLMRGEFGEQERRLSTRKKGVSRRRNPFSGTQYIYMEDLQVMHNTEGNYTEAARNSQILPYINVILSIIEWIVYYYFD